MNYYLAIDIGASSGRHILGHLEDGRIVLEEIYRFDNLQIHKNGHDCWDLDALRDSVLAGLAACAKANKIPTTVGIDTWAVDYLLLDEAGNPLGDAVAYRDKRTEGMDEVAAALVPPDKLYAKTGIQKQPFNTVYQLLAQKAEHPEQLDAAAHFLMIPEYLNYLLTGVMKNEYTNATSTNLVGAQSKTWDSELLTAFGLPSKLFGKLAMPGEVVGHLTPAVQAVVGFDCTVLLPATHDTGSAFLAVPARDTEAVYLSSGTWSLLGVENAEPITSEASRLENFTNEGGAWYRYRYLKNIMGLWMLQSVRRELNGVSYVAGKTAQRTKLDGEDGRTWGFQDLIAAAQNAADFASVVDVDEDAFLAPDSMIEALRSVCRAGGMPEPGSVGEVMQCIYKSLSLRYAQAIASLQALTGKRYTSINIVGGGCQDQYLNQCTANATGLPVYAGPIEGTALGNLMVQMIAAGDFADLAAARAALPNSFEIKVFTPQG